MGSPIWRLYGRVSDDKIYLVINKIKNYTNDPRIKQLQDVRVAGVLIFGVIAILVTWSSLGVIEQNYNLETEISKLQQQVKVQQLENNNLALQNQYYNSNEYLDLQARQLFGIAAPGEKEIIIPDSVALSNSVDVTNQTNLTNTASPPQPFYQRNFQAWMNFFFHRSTG